MKAKIFKQHPNLEVFYQTSDGTAFFKEHDAKNHAKTLKSKKVTAVFSEGEEIPFNETKEHIVSQEDLANNPELGDAGIQPGDVIEINADANREDLVARYTELFGKKPSHNAADATIAQRIDEKEASLKAEQEAVGTDEESGEEIETEETQEDETED